MRVKREVFAKIDKICKADALLATNTSTLDVDAIAGATARPESVIGMHFFSPANVMRLLEVVRGAKTSKTTIATAMAVGRRIGKVPVLVGVCDGFVGNRMLHARGKQAERLILEGALPHQVDKALYDFGFPMGPFAMGDLAGLDVGWRIRKGKGLTSPVADRLCEGALRPENGRGLLPLRGERSHADPGRRGREDHPRGRGRSGDPAARDLGRGDPRAPALPAGERRGEDSRGEARDPRERHRRDLGLRLRLARVPGWPDVLGGPGGAQDAQDPDARVRAPVRRGLAAGPPPRAAGGRGQGVPRPVSVAAQRVTLSRTSCTNPSTLALSIQRTTATRSCSGSMKTRLLPAPRAA